MKTIHLLVPSLFLPREVAAEACRGLQLPALEKILRYGTWAVTGNTGGAVSLEDSLCQAFGVTDVSREHIADAPIAAVSAAFDKLPAGCWMRADPVHLSLQRDHTVMLEVSLQSAEAAEFCASLNRHFSGQGIEFVAPHPQRWYVRVAALPHIRTVPPSLVWGGDVRGMLPTGEDALRWHQLFNEVQMLLYAHPLNQQREEQGTLPVNSAWFWGAGCNAQLALEKNFDRVDGDAELAAMFASAAGLPFASLKGGWRPESDGGRHLLVCSALDIAWRYGDIPAWRHAVREFETVCAMPSWQALRSGVVAQLKLDVPGSDGLQSVHLTRRDSWAFWKRSRGLAGYPLM